MAALAGSTAAWAGSTTKHEVYIDTTNRVFAGNFGAAHNSTDWLQFIDIMIQASASGEWGRILVADKNGVWVSCMFTDPSLISAAKALTSDSYIQASYDTNGMCTVLEVRTTSRHETKQH
ncbi:hypothetical protein D7W81_14535 [Corallococcus aberystwythensis]|uniref:Uncharacterized protein n=1 Tax=Corallococcus aberystwythensis TaxID=2316722 RepID=A0A3A8QV65_9BACT|nr:hypothetical protein D7W81_14535 [Corallococcus aberystwythensis]